MRVLFVSVLAISAASTAPALAFNPSSVWSGPAPFGAAFADPGAGSTLTAPALPAPARPTASVISQPEWQRKPSAEDLARLYPAKAAQQGKSGRATLRCRVKGDGTLEACVIRSETPVGLMFGEQALKLAPLFKMPPQARNGEPVAGMDVFVPVVFKTS